MVPDLMRNLFTTLDEGNSGSVLILGDYAENEEADRTRVCGVSLPFLLFSFKNWATFPMRGLQTRDTIE
jgi:hypothetical protein